MLQLIILFYTHTHFYIKFNSLYISLRNSFDSRNWKQWRRRSRRKRSQSMGQRRSRSCLFLVFLPLCVCSFGFICYDDVDQLVQVSITKMNCDFLLVFNQIVLIFYQNFRPNSTLQTLNANVASMWVKIISSWICVGLYIWTLVARAIFPNRDFD